MEKEVWKDTTTPHLEGEVWKSLDFMGYPNYSVSTLGRVKSIKYSDRVLTQHLSMWGYPSVVLCKESKLKNHRVHRLVAMAFIANPNNLPCVDHINTIKTVNRIDNLKWVTMKENSNNPLTKQHQSAVQKANGNKYCKFGEAHHMFGRKGKDSPVALSVVQISLKGEYIKTWDSIADAERELDIKGTHISGCCRGKRKTAYGYKWMYLSDYNNKNTVAI